MRKSTFRSESGEDDGKNEKEEPPNDFPGVDVLLQNNPVKDCVRLYYHRAAIDIVIMIVGVTYANMDGYEDMIPLYMIVRSALWLGCLPFHVAQDFQPSKGWKNKTQIALSVLSGIIEITIFGWLIYGTVIVSKRWPGSSERHCDKPCYLTAFSSVLIDWIWRLLITLALTFPICWFAVDQWTTALFFLYVSIKRSKKGDNSPVEQH